MSADRCDGDTCVDASTHSRNQSQHERDLVALEIYASEIGGNGDARCDDGQKPSIDLRNIEIGNNSADRQAEKIGAGNIADLHFAKAEIVHPGCGDDRQSDHDRVACQRHVDADR